MQRVTLVRYSAKPGQADQNEALSRVVFEQLRAERPAGLAYALLRQGDAFLHLFVNLEEDSSQALTGLASFEAFQRDFDARCEGAPDVQRLGMNLVEAYGFDRV